MDQEIIVIEDDDDVMEVDIVQDDVMEVDIAQDDRHN